MHRVLINIEWALGTCVKPQVKGEASVVNQDGGRWGTFSLSSKRQNQKHAQSGIKQVTLNGMQTLLTGIMIIRNQTQ